VAEVPSDVGVEGNVGGGLDVLRVGGRGAWTMTTTAIGVAFAALPTHLGEAALLTHYLSGTEIQWLFVGHTLAGDDETTWKNANTR
jgi:hypothetical protein